MSMTLDLWMGIAIGSFLAMGMILLVVAVGGNKNTERARLAADRNFRALQIRNKIGLRQVEALEAIAAVIDDGNDPDANDHDELVCYLVTVLKRFDIAATNQELIAAISDPATPNLTKAHAERHLDLRRVVAMVEGRAKK